MPGYHVPKDEAEKYVSRHKETKLQVKNYPDRHGEYPKQSDHGVWNVNDQHWEWVKE